MSYKINQIFTDKYPPEAAVWCNNNNAYIKELEPAADGKKQYQICAVPAPTQDDLFTSLRSQRDTLLASTDYYVMPDYPATDKSAVITYRQALRDLPSQAGAPWDGGGPNTPWPINPLG